MEFAKKREPELTPGVQKDDESGCQPLALDSDASEAELIRRAKRGDADSFGHLVTRYQDRVYNTMYRMSNSHADAMDLTQTAFLKAYQALGRFDARAGFYTWLFRIAANLATSHYRSRARRPTLSLHRADDERDHDPPATKDADPQGRQTRRDLSQRLERALAALPEDFRVAVVLKDLEDLDYSTIGEILGVPLGTVRSRIHRGRRLLREILTREERLGESD